MVCLIDSLDQGGAERSLVELLPAYADRGIQTTVAVLRAGGVFTAAAEKECAGVVTLDTSPQWPAKARRFGDLISRRRPDLVHTTLFESNVIGRAVAAAHRVPVVSSLVNTPYGPDQLTGIRRSIGVRSAQVLDASTARLVARFHANAAHVADTMERRLWIPRDRIEVIPRGRDDAALGRRTPERQARVRESLDIPAEAPLLLVVARHEKQKNLETAIEVLTQVRQEHPSAMLLIAGREGNETQNLKGLIASRSLDRSVRLLSHRDDVPDLLAAADLLLVTSRREGFPGAVVEAMALETPIVASDLPGTRDVLGDTATSLPHPDDVDAFADAVSSALNKTSDQTEARRHRFERELTVDTVADAMIDLYDRAIREHRGI